MPITAKDLLTKRFLRISTRHTLRETMGIILYGEQKKHDTGAIAVIDTDANFAGILTPQHVILGLLNDWNPPEGEELEEAFLKSAKDHLNKTIAEVLPKDQPFVSPDANLVRLIKLAGNSEYECIPVVEDGRVEGLVYTTDIFQSAAQLALTEQDEGIGLPAGA